MVIDQMSHFSFKVCLLGDAAVGKTSLVKRFVIDEFDDEYITTIGTKVSKKELRVPHPNQPDETLDVILTIWDIVGQPGLHTLRSMYYTGADGALVVGDLTRKDTFQSLTNWVASIYGKTGRIPVLILANKYDLKAKHQVTTADLDHLTTVLESSYLFTSAKSGENVERAFARLAQLMLAQSLTRRLRSPIEVLDSMVAEFCTLYGGLEAGMQPFKSACEEVGLNFNSPTVQDLEKVIASLQKKIRSALGEEPAEAFAFKHRELIRQLPS